MTKSESNKSPQKNRTQASSRMPYWEALKKGAISEAEPIATGIRDFHYGILGDTASEAFAFWRGARR